MTINELYKHIDSTAPLTLAEPGDHVGLLVGRGDRPVTGVLCALDITRAVIEEAEQWGAQVLLSHHPLFFDIHEVTGDTVEGDLVLMLAERSMAAICMHTNLDAAPQGVNEALAARIGLVHVCSLDAEGLSRIGEMPGSMDTQSFAAHCKQRIGCGVVRYADAGKPVRTVAVASGSGWDNYGAVRVCGADTFVTGDVKLSSFLAAQHDGINVLDCGHFATEALIFDTWIPRLQALCPGVDFRLSRQKEPHQCL